GIVLLPDRVRPAGGAKLSIVGRPHVILADDLGRFVLPVLPPGAHVIVARAEDRFAGVARIDVGADGFALEERPIVIALGETAVLVASGLDTVNPKFQPPPVELWLGGARTPDGPLPVASLRREKGSTAP